LSRESSEKESYIGLYKYLPQEPVDMAVVLTLILMSFYYVWRVAYITPWYDELYTYYYFISRGPLYAAIHWPLPNNHVGYSVLASIFDLFGNSYIGLRGVSFICAILNLFAVYRISRRFMQEWIAYSVMILYFICMLVNDLSVQGRGYTLATSCLLVCIREIIIICRKESDRIIDYVLFGMSLVLGLYTIPSSIYWVLPTCFATGIFLVVNGVRSLNNREKIWSNRYFKKLKKFIISGLIAAGAVLALYGIIWLAIGSNLLVKDEASAFFGMGHADVILHHPLKAAFRGIEYMLSQPYIQSVPRNGYLGSLWNWIKALSGYMYPIKWQITVIIVLLGVVLLIIECIRHFENSRTIFSLIIIMNAVGFLLIMIIQAKLPYYRVFSYIGIVTAVSCGIVLEHIHERILWLLGDKLKNFRFTGFLPLIPAIVVTIFAIFMFLDASYFAQHGSREADCYNALFVMNPDANKKLCVMDCDQQYLLKFGWGIECENIDPTGCDYVLIDRNMMEPNYKGADFWKFYQNHETIDWDTLMEDYYVFYENENFVLYKR